jgi:hypothetical protein
MTHGPAGPFHCRVAGYDIWGHHLPSGCGVGGVVVCEPVPGPDAPGGRAPVTFGGVQPYPDDVSLVCVGRVIGTPGM